MFSLKASLRHHLLTHTREAPRACNECGRAFIRQDCYIRHIRRKHHDLLEQMLQDAEQQFPEEAGSSGASSSSDGAGPSGEQQNPPVRDGGKRPTPKVKEALEAGLMNMSTELVTPEKMDEGNLTESLKELLSLLVDEATLRNFGWPERPVDELLEAVIRRCGHSPASHNLFAPADRLR